MLSFFRSLIHQEWLCVLFEVGIQFFPIWLAGINMADHGFVVPPESHIIVVYFHGSLLDNWSKCFYSTGLMYLLLTQYHTVLISISTIITIMFLAYNMPHLILILLNQCIPLNFHVIFIISCQIRFLSSI